MKGNAPRFGSSRTMSVIALIPAGGFGSRFHDGGPKALVRLAGKPLILHALERLAATRLVDRAVVAVPEEHAEEFEAALRDAPLPCLTVSGGVTRRDSVANAFRASGAAGDDLVCVHDAARPLVDPADAAAVIEAAKETGAAVAAFAMIETVKRVQNGRVVETVPRHDLAAAVTPQVFRADLLKQVLEKEGMREVTDDAELVERSGSPVAVVLTSRWNLKITYPEDLLWAEAFLAWAKARG